ncbi:MAG: helix-turn-helix transcriptional regulator [Kiritimatiellae bacterium]|nr:helix-turn-helix transcriptional regulator [Kiritimatiellia bacterium]
MKNQRTAIAERIRGLRDAADITELETAEKTGVDVEIYRQYESGELDVPMSYITRLAAFFRIDPTAIITGGDAHARSFYLTRSGTGPVIERVRAYHYEALGAGFSGRAMEPFVVTVEPSLNDRPHLNTHPGQEFNYVLSGRLWLSIDGSELVLNPGDSIYFDALKPHGMRALDNKPTTFLAIITA